MYGTMPGLIVDAYVRGVNAYIAETERNPALLPMDETMPIPVMTTRRIRTPDPDPRDSQPVFTRAGECVRAV